MARPKYPSDTARVKQRPHVKVHLSWMTHPRYAEAFADFEIRAIVLGVWMVAAQAHASATDDTVTLNPGLICSVTGRQQLRSALPALRRACVSMQWAISQHGASVQVHIRNYSKKQGFTTQLRTTPHPSEEPNTEEPKNRRTEEEKSAAPPRPPPATAGSRVRKAAGLRPPPETLSDPELARLAAWCAEPEHPFTPEQARFAVEAVLGWARAGGKRKADWVQTVENALRDGWGLKGFVGPNGTGPPARAAPPRFEGVEERNQREIREWVEEQKQKSATS